MTTKTGQSGPLGQRIRPVTPVAPVPVPVYSRWRASTLTFGPAGRLVATALVLLPVLYGIFVNAMFLLAGAIWLFVLPRALRDIWGRVRVRDELQLPKALLGPEPTDENPIATRAAPARW